MQDLREKMRRSVNTIHARLHEKYMEDSKVFAYAVGDRVWIRNLPGETTKLDPLYSGPYEVVRCHEHEGRYVIRTPEGVKDVHQDRMKMYLPRVDGSTLPLHYYKPTTLVPEGDSYVVERILDHRVNDGRHEWLVRWHGYDESGDTWEPAESFVGTVHTEWLRFNRRNEIDLTVNEVYANR